VTGTDSAATIRVAGGRFLESLELPAATADVEPSPGMLTDAERALLSQVVRRTWRGHGAIVDGGSFLGSSLVAEAQGLEANPVLAGLDLDTFPSSKPIHGYELGYHPVPAHPAAPRLRRYGSVEYVLGESFVPALEQVIAPHRHLIDLHIGDLMEQSWNGSPIELAFIDVCKTQEINAHVSREFYPSLIGGGSTLIHQDFFFDLLPWIRVSMGYLAEYFRWEGQVASSAVFSNVKAVPEDVAAYDPFTEATLEECLAYHDAVTFPGIDRTAQLMLALSRVRLILERGSRDQALELLTEAAVEYDDILGVASRGDSPHWPTPGSPESMLPRHRMDLTLAHVLRPDDSRRRRNPEVARTSTTRPATELDRARDAASRRDWDQARRILAPFVATEPDGPGAVLLARTELESGHPDVAAAMVEDLVTRKPGNARARALRAEIHLNASDHAAARAEAEHALRINPTLVSARRVLFEVEVAERLRARPARP